MKIIDSGKNSAFKNMSLDAELLNSLKQEKKALLHFYEWETMSFTYGLFAPLEQLIDLQECQKAKIIGAKRPTGGGLLFHIWDYAFSLLLPAEHPWYQLSVIESYHAIHSRVAKALSSFLQGKTCRFVEANESAFTSFDLAKNFCMAKPTIYDVLIDDKKLIGAAQRRKKQGLLQQMTISLITPDFDLLKRLLLNKKILQEMKTYTYPLLPNCNDLSILEEVKQEIKENIIQEFTKDLS